jgi:hypothetical protein
MLEQSNDREVESSTKSRKLCKDTGARVVGVCKGLYIDL